MGTIHIVMPRIDMACVNMSYTVLYACVGTAYIVTAYIDTALCRYGLYGYNPISLRPYVGMAYIVMAYIGTVPCGKGLYTGYNFIEP